MRLVAAGLTEELGIETLDSLALMRLAQVILLLQVLSGVLKYIGKILTKSVGTLLSLILNMLLQEDDFSGIHDPYLHIKTTFSPNFTILIDGKVIPRQRHDIKVFFVIILCLFCSVVNSDRCCATVVATSVYGILLGNFYGSAFCHLCIG